MYHGMKKKKKVVKNMKKGSKMSLMKNPKGGYKKHKGSSLTMNLPIVKTHGGK